MDFLTELDKLVQLIESPIFACEYFEYTGFPNRANTSIRNIAVNLSGPITVLLLANLRAFVSFVSLVLVLFQAGFDFPIPKQTI